MLCKVCSSIHFKRLSECSLCDEPLEEDEPWEDVPWEEDDSWEEDDPLEEEVTAFERDGMPLYYFHHENKFELKESADHGCHFCVIIWTALFASVTFDTHEPLPVAGNRVYLEGRHYGSMSSNQVREIKVLCENRMYWCTMTWDQPGMQSYSCKKDLKNFGRSYTYK